MRPGKEILGLSLLLFFFLAGCGGEGSGQPKSSASPAALPGACSLAGRVLYDGPPSRRRAPAGDSLAVCSAARPGGIPDESLLVKNGALRNAVVFVRSGPILRGKVAPSGPVTLDQIGCLFEPRVIAMREGQALWVRNSDPMFHNVTLRG